MTHISRGIAQLVEHWSPKPGVVGSSPATPAIRLISFAHGCKPRLFKCKDSLESFLI